MRSHCLPLFSLHGYSLAHDQVTIHIFAMDYYAPPPVYGPPYVPPVQLTTTVITTSTTLTSYVTVTTPVSSTTGKSSGFSSITGGTSTTRSAIATSSSVPDVPVIPAAIRGLPPCAQGIVLENLANSACNPSDAVCICTDLGNLGISDKVGAKCTPADQTQYSTFQSNVCNNTPFPPTTTIIVTPTPAPVVEASSTLVAPPAAYTPVAIDTPVSVAPFPNATASTMVSVVPVTPTAPTDATPTGSAPAEFTGGASSVEIGVLAGVVGLMGFVFAEL
jgi:hypothetical protein